MIKLFVKKILSQRVLDYISNIMNLYLDRYAIKSYSQEGEDMILKYIFGDKPIGYYVDVGAHHPKRFSNTYYFYKKGWNGINIDAMPGSMRSFKRFRPRDINIEKPISNTNQVLRYYAFNEPALNGFSKKLSEERDGINNYRILFTKDIQTYTLDDILDKYLPKKQIIDFLSIDVEGLDFDVLKSMNLKKYKPRVILIEILGSSLIEIQQNPICDFLVKRDYTLYAKAVNSIIFKSNSF